MVLTVANIKNAKPGRHSDGRGLSLLVKPSGSKSWTLRVQRDGKRQDYGLGPFPELSLANAREKALEWRRQIDKGIDPRRVKAKQQAGDDHFSVIAQSCFQARKDGWKNEKHVVQWITTLEIYAFPVLANIPVNQISPSMIVDVLKPIWLTKAETGRRVKQRISAVLDYAHAQGLRDHEAPNRAIQMGLPRQPKRNGHHAALPYSETPSFYQSLCNETETVGRLALLFTILTAARTSEARLAIWEEIDVSENNWTIPPERMKAGESHIVPISNEALKVLAKLRGYKEFHNGKFLFPGQRQEIISNGTMSKVMKDCGAGAFTVHGFRSSFRDWAAEQTSFSSDVAESALAHVQSNKVEAAYRRTKFLEKRRDLMQQWADYLRG